MHQGTGKREGYRAMRVNVILFWRQKRGLAMPRDLQIFITGWIG
jgi:hypothetical protein